MKTKALLLVCLFLGIGLTQPSAQVGHGKNGTGAVTKPYHGDWDTYWIDIPVDCNTAKVDRLYGTVSVSGEMFFKEGVFMHENKIFIGELKSLNTDEVFSVNDHWKWEFPNLFGTGHLNIKGSKGTHYILFYTIDFLTLTTTFQKAVCK